MKLRLALLIASVLLCAAHPARAMSFFSRKYAVSCRTCHTDLLPRLNPFGYKFKERGYVMPGEELEEVDQRDEPRVASDNSALKDFPFAVRLRSAILFPTKGSAPQPEVFDLQTPQLAALATGGRLARGAYTYFINAPFIDNGILKTPAIAYFQINGLFGSNPRWNNLRVGRYYLFDWQFPTSDRLTISNQRFGRVQVGVNPFRYEDPVDGINYWTRPHDGSLSFELAFTDSFIQAGETPNATRVDLSDSKNVYGRVEWDLSPELRLGIFGHSGVNSVRPPGVAAFNDAHHMGGLDAEAFLPGVHLRAVALRAQHDNPGLGLADVAYTAGMFDAVISFTPKTSLEVRYDLIRSSRQPTLDAQVLTPALHYLLLANLRLTAEFNADLDGREGDIGALVMDTAF